MNKNLIQQLKEEEFVLPEKWCIKSNEYNYREIYCWLRKHKQNCSHYTNLNDADKTSYIHFPVYKGFHQCSQIIEGYTQITFEQFKKYVLKQETMKVTIEELKVKKDNKYWVVKITNEKDHAKLKVIFPKLDPFNADYKFYLTDLNSYGHAKDVVPYPSTNFNVIDFEDIDFSGLKLIGYKLIKPEYSDAVKKIADLTNFEVFKSYLKTQAANGDNLKAYNKCVEKLNKAGVLDLWFEEVYEDPNKLPVINNYKAELNGELLVYGCAKFSAKNIRALAEDVLSFNNPSSGLVGYSGGNRKVISLTLDSGVSITVEELEQIYKYLNAKNI